MLRLSFINGENTEADLDKPRLTIGRDRSNDLVLDAPGVSGFHAEIQTENARSFLVDLGSSNGTFVNGKRIAGRQELKAWDSVAFEKVEAEVIDTERRRPTMVSRAISDSDLKKGGAGHATQLRPAVAGQWNLIGISGPTSGKKFVLAGKMVVGREPSCDIAIESQMVSRRHAEVEAAGGTVKLRDLGSANGTFVNGSKVTETTLKAGDEIKFDQNVFRVEGPGGESSKTSVRPAVGGAATQMRPSVAAGTQVVEAPKASLVATSGNLAGRRFDLRGAQLTVGRTEENDITISDPTVSGSHARLVAAAGSWRIEDVGSSNGTFVNGTKITTQPLRAGDMLRFGKVELKFEDPTARPAGTQVLSSVGDDTKTSMLPAAKKSLPAWAYGLIGFLIVGTAVGLFFAKDKLGFGAPKQIEAKLQGSKLWSQQLSNGRTGPTTPVLADINGDKFLDVIVADASGFVVALDGQAGKKIFEAEASDRILAPPAVGDLTGDGIDDVVVASNSGIVVALNGKGQILWKSAADLNLGAVLNRPVLQDINGDGVPDVIVPTANKGLVALDGSHGWELWNTASMAHGKIITSPLRADLNGDGVPDFVAVADSGHVMAVSSQGKKVWELWEADLPAVYYASPLYIKSGDKGVVVVATDGGGIFALNAANGRTVWSDKIDQRFFASPVATDANGDGVPDVVAVAQNGDIHVLNGLTGDEIWSTALGTPVQGSPALYDVNGDGLKDLVLTDDKGAIHVVDMARGRDILTLPVNGADSFIASPVLGDINNDQMVDVLAASQNGEISAYSLNRLVKKGSSVWPMFLGNDQHGLN